MKFLGITFARNSTPLPSETEVVNQGVERAINNYYEESDNGSFTTTEGSLSISAVWACVRLISETIATLPIHVYRKNETGREKISDHFVSELLRRPNNWQNKSQFLKTIISHLLLWGNGYAVIIRDRYYRPVSLVIYHPSKVSPRLENGVLKYRVSGISAELDAWDIIHLRGMAIDGIVGKSPIAVHRENLDLANSSLRYGSDFFKKGGNTSGVYEHPGELSDQAYERLRAQITTRSHGLENAHRPLLLEGGMKYSRVNIPLEDAQFIATRKFQKSEIATIYGVPPHMIGDLERSTNNNIEQQAIEFVSYCLRPYLVEIEDEINGKLMLEVENDKTYAVINDKALMRGDAIARSTYWRNLFYIGVFSQNEIRELEDMNPIEGGDEHFVQTNMSTVENIIKNEQKPKPGA